MSDEKKKKGFFKKLIDKIDEKLEEESKETKDCCDCNSEEDESCCS